MPATGGERRAGRVAVAAALGVALGLAFCVQGGPRPAGGEPCTDESGCEAPRLCQYGRCREPCLVDADCPDGVCLTPETEGASRVCSLPDEPGCEGCAGRCVDGVCVGGPVEPDGDADGDIDAEPDAEVEPDGDADEPPIDGGPALECRDLADQTLGPGVSYVVTDASVDLGVHPASLEFVVDLTGTPVGEGQVDAGLGSLPLDVVPPAGRGGWVVLYCFDETPSPETLRINDKVHLQAAAFQAELVYDIVGTVLEHVVHAPPIGTDVNYGIWFDRDGVDPYQAELWGAVEGGTYATAGVYRVRVDYFPLEGAPGRAGMLATVNGVATGFFAGEWANGEPDHYPAGLSFDAELSELAPFFGSSFRSGAPVTVREIRVCGVFVP